MQQYCSACDAEVCHERICQEFNVRGETIHLDLPVARCLSCGTQELDGVDPAERAFAIYRAHHGLLTPERIREIRESLGLHLMGFAIVVDIPEDTLKLYEGGVANEPT